MLVQLFYLLVFNKLQNIKAVVRVNRRNLTQYHAPFLLKNTLPTRRPKQGSQIHSLCYWRNSIGGNWILIALQINNWNEARKTHIYEQKILTDLLHSVNGDLGIHKMLIDRLDSMEFGISNIYRLIGKNESSNDSIQKYIPYLMM